VRRDVVIEPPQRWGHAIGAPATTKRTVRIWP
jgi:hypothetical protein